MTILEPYKMVPASVIRQIPGVSAGRHLTKICQPFWESVRLCRSSGFLSSTAVELLKDGRVG